VSDATIDPRLTSGRSAPKHALRLSWSDPRFRAIVWQVVILGGVAAIAWYLIANTNRNLASRHIATGFGFVGRTAGIPIGESPISYDPAINTYGRALLIGVLNTLKVSVVGIVLATILGTLVGIGRLSKNWLMARLTAFYVETIRDLPLLLQLLFWYSVMRTLPAPRNALQIGWKPGDIVSYFAGWWFNTPEWTTGIILSNRGLKLPTLNWESAHTAGILALLAGAAGTLLWNRHARRRQEATGVRPAVWPVALALLAGLPLLLWAVMGAPFQWDVPVLHGFNFTGGLTVTPEYGALLLGLVIYTAAYIAEIVRAGIQAVPQGQWEAAGALGIRHGVVLRKIVLPQALRVIIPPMTSQYLNLTKNSSLAVAIGYQDIVSVANTTLNQTGQAIEGIAVIMAVYLTISLTISLFMNWYNARIALVER
jgi:general L-amino acid transport system permease protein